ncbi:hypothetical protein NPX13_g4995 [Xylaria arbuscula]|uniref:Uncharacterized protein n=1 Tax=Xylaria arbuscula TaxID=114810 RepID=A0A9W8TNK3_9PEZI|nr:hypothetical protein NPX13_g4995 [Xylaria arbuscula]
MGSKGFAAGRFGDGPMKGAVAVVGPALWQSECLRQKERGRDREPSPPLFLLFIFSRGLLAYEQVAAR